MTNVDPRFASTVYFVEANRFESMTLWREHHETVPWVDDLKGCMACMGHIDQRPVCVSFLWTKIHGSYICFYEPMSEVVDYVMIKNYLRVVARETVEENRVIDAGNFRVCVQFCRWIHESNQQKPRLCTVP